MKCKCGDLVKFTWKYQDFPLKNGTITGLLLEYEEVPPVEGFNGNHGLNVTLLCEDGINYHHLIADRWNVEILSEPG
jgi:hypothetical protein